MNLWKFGYNPWQPTRLAIVIIVIRQLAQHQYDQRTQNTVQNIQWLDPILGVQFAKVTASQFHNLCSEIVITLNVFARDICGVFDNGVEAHKQLLKSLGKLTVTTPRVLAKVELDGIVIAIQSVMQSVNGELSIKQR